MENMLSEALREIRGPLNQLLVNFEGEDGEKWLAEFKKFLRKEKCWTDVVIDNMLELIGTVIIPARTKKFIARDHFIMDTSKKAKVKISYLGDNFKKNFLDKTEEAITETEFRYHHLKKSSRDILIINKLGGEDKAETTLVEMFSLMELQPNGNNGALLTNSYANIFYIRGTAPVLWAVHCHWHGDGWDVNAYSVGRPDGWSGGGRVFSLNSSDIRTP